MYNKVQKEIQNLSPSDEVQTSQDIDNSSLMFSFFSRSLNTSNVRSKNNSNEIDRYRQVEELLVHESNDPLIWWKANCNAYPNLSVLAQKYLSIPATSVPSERLFSDAGIHVTSLRNRLDSRLVNQILFIKQNKKYLEMFP